MARVRRRFSVITGSVEAIGQRRVGAIRLLDGGPPPDEQPKPQTPPTSAKRRKKLPGRIKAARLKERLERIEGIKPNPVQIDELDHTDRPPIRCFECPSYEDCMRVACVGAWLGFSCEHCALFAKFGHEWERARARKEIEDGALDRRGPGQTYPAGIFGNNRGEGR